MKILGQKYSLFRVIAVVFQITPVVFARLLMNPCKANRAAVADNDRDPNGVNRYSFRSALSYEALCARDCAHLLRESPRRLARLIS